MYGSGSTKEKNLEANEIDFVLEQRTNDVLDHRQVHRPVLRVLETLGMYLHPRV